MLYANQRESTREIDYYYFIAYSSMVLNENDM